MKYQRPFLFATLPCITVASSPHLRPWYQTFLLDAPFIRDLKKRRQAKKPSQGPGRAAMTSVVGTTASAATAHVADAVIWHDLIVLPATVTTARATGRERHVAHDGVRIGAAE